MGRLWLLIVPLSVLLHSTMAIACPSTLPPGCTCNDDPGGRISVQCANVSAELVLKSLSGTRVDHLRLTNCALSLLDSPLPLASLKSLELISCGLTTVRDEALSPVASSLEELNLSYNLLTTVPLLRKLGRLVSLNLDGNQINDIPDGAFDGLPVLRQLRLEGNKICSLSSTALSETKSSLELLDLSANCLSVIPAQALRSSLKLMYLDLASNKISEIGNFNLMNLPKLKELRLNDNLLNTVHPMSFMNVPELQTLNMRNNLIADLDGNRLQAFSKLELLDVRNNMLSRLPSFKELPQLKQILLDGNLISKVDTLAFTANPRLQLISLQDNAISVVARNSFDSLDQLVVLLLANNSIRTLERGMLDGMKNLQQLNLRNNSLLEVDEASFAPLPQLTSVDLAFNRINRVAKGTFDHHFKLFWLDLSGNQLRGFEQGTFTRRISNMLLDGNPLECDESLDWFINYLVVNQVRTFLPAQSEILCAGPPNYAGVPLKELMIRKANETLTKAANVMGLHKEPSGINRNLLNTLLPQLGGLGGQAGQQPMTGLGLLNTFLPGANRAADGQGSANSGWTKLTDPLIRLANGGQNRANDVQQLLQDIPSMVVNIPGFGDIDVSQLPPDTIAYVLKGGQIPGLSREMLNGIIAKYTSRMAQMADALKKGEKPKDVDKVLPPLKRLPIEFVTSVMDGGSLPGLDTSQTDAIRRYYTDQLPTELTTQVKTLPAINISPQMFEMMKLLPAGYNYSLIPKEVMDAIGKGEVPDLNLLPQDLQDHLKSRSVQMLTMFSGNAMNNGSLDDLLKKLPRWKRPVLPSFSPYDINEINNELVQEEEAAAKAARLHLYSAIALAAIGAVSIVVVILLCINTRRARMRSRGLVSQAKLVPHHSESVLSQGPSTQFHQIHRS